MEARRRQAHNPLLRSFYAAYQYVLKTPINQVSYVALDFETTGLNPVEDAIVSIGLVPFDLERVLCAKAAHWLVRPESELHASSVVIHGITHADLSKAPDLNFILEELLSALAGRIIVVHCHQVERPFLNAALLQRMEEGITFPVVDTMAIESTMQHKIGGGLWNRLRGRRPGSVRLAESRRRYGLPYYRSHHALTDALATAELFQAQAAHYFTSGTCLGELLI
jgi:DNA polymerase III subunit epsilon